MAVVPLCARPVRCGPYELFRSVRCGPAWDHVCVCASSRPLGHPGRVRRAGVPCVGVSSRKSSRARTGVPLHSRCRCVFFSGPLRAACAPVFGFRFFLFCAPLVSFFPLFPALAASGIAALWFPHPCLLFSLCARCLWSSVVPSPGCAGPWHRFVGLLCPSFNCRLAWLRAVGCGALLLCCVPVPSARLRPCVFPATDALGLAGFLPFCASPPPWLRPCVVAALRSLGCTGSCCAVCVVACCLGLLCAALLFLLRCCAVLLAPCGVVVCAFCAGCAPPPSRCGTVFLLCFVSILFAVCVVLCSAWLACLFLAVVPHLVVLFCVVPCSLVVVRCAVFLGVVLRRVAMRSAVLCNAVLPAVMWFVWCAHAVPISSPASCSQ